VSALSRCCGRAGCSLRGQWTDQERCPACNFPTRAGSEAHIARSRAIEQGIIVAQAHPVPQAPAVTQAAAPTTHPGPVTEQAPAAQLPTTPVPEAPAAVATRSGLSAQATGNPAPRPQDSGAGPRPAAAVTVAASELPEARSLVHVGGDTNGARQDVATSRPGPGQGWPAGAGPSPALGRDSHPGQVQGVAAPVAPRGPFAPAGRSAYPAPTSGAPFSATRIDDCTIVGGDGAAFAPGTMGRFTCDQSGVTFLVGDDRGTRFGYEDLLGIEVAAVPADGGDQASAATGLSDPLDRAVGKHVLGRLASRSPVNTLVGLVTRDGSMVFHTSSVTTGQAEERLAPALGALGT